MGRMPDDYVEVSERIQQFREKHPEGTLQSEIVRWESDIVVVKAYAYRTPDDPRPGVGLASEPVPGPTNFTRDSELMNAETSAWGRALIAVGAADAKRGVASADEVRHRQQPSQAQQKPSEKQLAEASAVIDGLRDKDPAWWDAEVAPKRDDLVAFAAVNSTRLENTLERLQESYDKHVEESW